MVSLGLTRMRDTGIGDVSLCLCKLKSIEYRAQIDAIHCIN